MKFFSKSIGIFEVILAIVLIGMYYFMTFISETDIRAHAQFVKDYAYGNKPFQVNFLYYFTIYLVTFFSSKSSALLVASVYVLTIATFVKYTIVKDIFVSQLSASYANIKAVSSWSSALLIFCFSLPSILYFMKDYYYLLSYPPNVWHNSTTIFAMPFVVLLFWTSLKQLEEFQTKRLFIIGLLIILNVIAKPSFVFVYLLAYPLLLLKKYHLSKLFWVNIIPIFVAVLLIAAEYYFIYIGSPTPPEGKSSVTIDFFYFIKTWAAEGNVIVILISTILSSFLFPIVMLLKNRQLVKETMVQFAVLCVIIAIIIANTLTETGARSSDGNFLWQSYMCSYILFFVCTLQLLKLKAASQSGWKPFRLELLLLGLHIFAGIMYFAKIVELKSYY